LRSTAEGGRGPVRTPGPIWVWRSNLDLFNKRIQEARDLGDDGTEELLSDLLTAEEALASWLEAQLEAAPRLEIRPL